MDRKSTFFIRLQSKPLEPSFPLLFKEPYLAVFFMFAVLRHVHLVHPPPTVVALHRREHEGGPVALMQLIQNLLSAPSSANKYKRHH